MPPGPDAPDLAGAARFLTAHLDGAVGAFEPAGEGMWSRAFGFVHDGRALVARFGRHVDDYEKDRRAAAWSSPTLPVPAVLEIVRWDDDGWCCISERAYGDVLEHLDADGWRAVLPSLLDVYDALRDLDVSGTRGWGGWDGDGVASLASWGDFLLAVGADDPTRRTHGWREQLRASPFGDDAFVEGERALRALVPSLPLIDRTVVHADLINRNVLVDATAGRITSVFDWGCSLYGDFLYELAWLQMWEPWYPAMVEADVVGAITRHLRARERATPAFDERLTACLLHIGLDHIAYNAWTGDIETLGLVIDRTSSFIA